MTLLSLNAVTTDKFLDGKLTIKQPKNGYRTGMDAVLLAATVSAGSGDKVLEVGTGVGTAMLCLAVRVQDCYITGLEVQHELVELAQKNIVQNNMQATVNVIQGDLIDTNLHLEAQSFSHVMANPPYFKSRTVTPSSQLSRNIGNIEKQTTLKQWITFCLKMLKPKGMLTLIFTAARLDELMAELSGKIGCITVFPLWSKVDQPAKRFIIQGIKNCQGETKLSYGLIIHENDGTFTALAQTFLRQGCYLKIN